MNQHPGGASRPRPLPDDSAAMVEGLTLDDGDPVAQTAANPAEAALVERLTAYLDGELDADESRQIEELLASDDDVRQKVRRLESIWELLEHLPHPEVDESFTQSTVELVALRAADDLEEQRSSLVKRRWLRTALLGAALFLGGLGGVLLFERFVPQPDRQLLRNYPLLEDFDAYRHAGDADYLRQLQQEQLFHENDRP